MLLFSFYRAHKTDNYSIGDFSNPTLFNPTMNCSSKHVNEWFMDG